MQALVHKHFIVSLLSFVVIILMQSNHRHVTHLIIMSFHHILILFWFLPSTVT